MRLFRGFILTMLIANGETVMSQTDSLRTHHLQEVEVTGTNAMASGRTAVPVFQMDSRQLLRMGVADMTDAMHRLPGITLRDYGGAGGMKTVSVRGFGASHTGVSYDGVVLSECQSGEIDLSRYSLDNVARLRLTIGDGDDLFVPARQSASPALLAIETLQPELVTQLHTQLRTGSFGLVSPFVKYDCRVSHCLTLSVLGDYTYAENDYPFTLTNGTQTISKHRTNSRMSQGHGELTLRWQPTAVSRLTAKTYYYDSDRHLPGLVRYYSDVSRERLHDRTAFAQLHYQTRWAERWALKAVGKWNWASTSYRDPLYTGGVRDADYWQREGYASACLLFTPHERWTTAYAADYVMNSLNSSLPTDVRPLRHTVLQSLSAKYQSARLKAIGRLLYTCSLNNARRGTSARDGRRLSPSLSLSWQPFASQQLLVRASYKNIFRLPTFNESYFFHYGSPTLEPESTDQLNIGFTYTSPLTKQTTLHATLDGYENHVKDKIVAVPYNMFIWQCINVGKVRVRGLDATLSLTHRMTEGHALLLTANYSYQQAENRTSADSPYYGLQLAYMPVHQGAASLSWENPWVNMTLHTHGVSKRWATNQHYADTDISGYDEWGIAAHRELTIGRQRIDVRMDVKNLFDRQYEIVGHYPMPGRSWQLSLAYHI